MLAFPTLFRDTRVRIALVLVGVWIIALLDSQLFIGPRFELLFPLLTIILTIFFDLIFTKIKGERLRFPSSSLVTGLLIGLILEPHEYVWLSFILATMIASTTKQLLRLNSRHIFNPAAIGLVTTSLITGAPIAWWAAAASVWTIPIIALGAGLILYKIRRFWLPITFLLAYGFYLWVSGGMGEIRAILPLVFDGTTFLFAFVMLPEPMTSPSRGWWKFVWGPMIVVILILYQRLLPVPTDPFLLALLTANVIWWILRNGPQKITDSVVRRKNAEVAPQMTP